MSHKCYIKPTTFNIFPSGQITSAWTGNSTIVGYINAGSYIISYNPALRSTSGSGITSTQFIVTINAAYGSAGYKEILATPKSGPMGCGPTQIFNGSFQNEVQILADNTPVYVNMQLSILSLTTWGVPTQTAQYRSYCNRLIFIPVQ
jgi:hypothetical protein